MNYDYANYSAHLFLADSYNELRDPNEINLRYETPAESEYLVANLLAPVSAGPLSPTISQGEYSRLFAHDGFGVVSRHGVFEPRALGRNRARSSARLEISATTSRRFTVPTPASG